MSRSENRPQRSVGRQDAISAWLIVAVLLLALALVTAFDAAVSEGVQAIAEFH